MGVFYFLDQEARNFKNLVLEFTENCVNGHAFTMHPCVIEFDGKNRKAFKVITTQPSVTRPSNGFEYVESKLVNGKQIFGTPEAIRAWHA